MSIAYQILGAPGHDNALFIRVDSGQTIERLLFDCGEGCPGALAFAETQEIDDLFFSHLHMDHVSGFDSFFRCVFNRVSKPNRIWGPPDTTRIIHHRLQGFLWNLHEQLESIWHVTDILPQELRTSRMIAREAFAHRYPEEVRPYDSVIHEGAAYTIEARTMDHHTPSMAYLIRERPRWNVDVPRLAGLGLRPGPWMKALKDPALGSEATINIDGKSHSLDTLRQTLLVSTPGDSIAYLTDFLLDEAAIDSLSDWLRDCRTLVCEAQYRHADLELARKHCHMTTALTAELARRSAVGELVLFHLSSRYEPPVWNEMLTEARMIFPKTRFSDSWAV